VDSKNQLATEVSIAGTYNDSYDGNGNLTGRNDADFGTPVYTYAYDAENQLTNWISYHQGTAQTRTDWVYDGLTRLRTRLEYSWNGTAWILNSTTLYVYDGRRLIQERDGSNIPMVSYTRGSDLSGSFEGAGGIGGLLARSHGYSSGSFTNHNFYHGDGGGNITYMVDASQNMVASYRYDPFGNILSKSGPLADANTYRFSSKDYHANSGLYYYGYRFYDPNLQRWPNRDPIEESGGINLYGFVENSPLNGVDLLGLEGKDLPPGFRYYPPGAASTGKGDWVPGSDLSDCLAAADERYLKRLRRDSLDEVPKACIPGEAKHFKDFLHSLDRAAESSRVRSLDRWACYMTWDPQHMPPYLKQLLR